MLDIDDLVDILRAQDNRCWNAIAYPAAADPRPSATPNTHEKSTCRIVGNFSTDSSVTVVRRHFQREDALLTAMRNVSWGRHQRDGSISAEKHARHTGFNDARIQKTTERLSGRDCVVDRTSPQWGFDSKNLEGERRKTGAVRVANSGSARHQPVHERRDCQESLIPVFDPDTQFGTSSRGRT